jgi:hypothetical protein
MKVNILGRGMIPFVGVLAPIRDVELNEKQIRSLMNFKTLRVYDTESGYLISKTTVNDFFNKKAQPVVKPIVTKPEPPKVEPTPVVEPVKEEVIEEPKFAIVTEEPVQVEEETIATVEDIVDEVVEESVDDTVEDDADKTEEKSEYTFKKKNKKRH